MNALARDIRLPAALPEPDYSDSDDDCHQMAAQSGCRQAVTLSSDGLILPRKLVNPCLDSADRRELHRELVFNHKIGRNVLGQKSELQRAMEKHRDQKDRRQTQMGAHKSSFEQALEERLLRVEPKITEEVPTKLDSVPEFLKVHARVRSNVNAPS